MSFAQHRATAETIACPEPHCAARPGDTCRNLSSGQPLENRPAHERRLTAAGLVTEPSDDTWLSE